MQYLLKTKEGPVLVAGKQIMELRKKKLISRKMKVISMDGGDTWITYAEMMEKIQQGLQARDVPATSPPPSSPPPSGA